PPAAGRPGSADSGRSLRPTQRVNRATTIVHAHARFGRGPRRGGAHTAASLYRSRGPENVDCRSYGISDTSPVWSKVSVDSLVNGGDQGPPPKLGGVDCVQAARVDAREDEPMSDEKERHQHHRDKGPWQGLHRCRADTRLNELQGRSVS